jgi:transcriptional regulator of acetoin/glycerol metabolism/DNA-binding CsgD family transcriptional regulator
VAHVNARRGTKANLREQLSRSRNASVGRAVRHDIKGSWQRSWSAGLEPGRFTVPFRGEVAGAELLLRAADPVLHRLSDDLSDSALSVILSDAGGAVLRRLVPQTQLLTRLDEIQLAPGFDYAEAAVGTNAIGTALAARRPAFVNGGEHFADELTDMACAAAPIIDRRNARLLGVVDVTSQAGDAHPLMITVVRHAALEIARELIAVQAPGQRRLYERFQVLRRRTKTPFALVGAGHYFANPAGSRLLDDASAADIWELVRDAATAGAPNVTGQLTRGPAAGVPWRAEPVREATELVAAVVHLDPPALGSIFPAELTEAEVAVAELVATGLSNRDAASRLLVSPHTVDAHLRHIYSKLGISSRIQLTRWLQEQTNRS